MNALLSATGVALTVSLAHVPGVKVVDKAFVMIVWSLAEVPDMTCSFDVAASRYTTSFAPASYVKFSVDAMNCM